MTSALGPEPADETVTLCPRHAAIHRFVSRRSIGAILVLAVIAGVVVVSIVNIGGEDGSRPKGGPAMTFGSPARQYDDIELDGAGTEALQTLVDGYSEMVAVELDKLKAVEPVFAVALMPGQEGLDVAPVVAVGTERDRKRLFQSEDGFGATYVWNGNEYSELIQASFQMAPAQIADAWRTLAKQLNGRVPNPVLWTLARVAYRLNRMDLGLQATDDFIVYAYDDDGGDDQTYGLKYSAPEASFRLLDKRGYIPEP